jgi:hypothetical protein
MNNKLLTTAIATALGASPLIAHAGNLYLTAGGGETNQLLEGSQVNQDWTTGLTNAGETFHNSSSGVSSAPSTNSPAAWRAGVGYQFLPFLAGEVEYLHLGEAQAKLTGQVDGPEGAVGHSTYTESAWGVSAIAQWPMAVSPFVRVGVLRWTESVNVAGSITIPGFSSPTATVNYSYSNNGESLYGGVGVEYKIPGVPVALRAEWDKLKVGDSGPNLVTASVVVFLPF